MKDAIRQRAAELGFDDCRFTTAAPPASVKHFQHWLSPRVTFRKVQSPKSKAQSLASWRVMRDLMITMKFSRPG
jgi:epoxyqueuosine reductase QueG